ncbi:hypothetical protein SGL43_07250 [Streptomyces globisporus]|uniref:Uncharacterized protein n=1 Tax=Streptomyces globisporus TaxID=1908 RepID=A0ABN8VEG5_STRGL|nr:hypothetical protein SGL43_07250 [Streptomyces globisporus]
MVPLLIILGMSTNRDGHILRETNRVRDHLQSRRGLGLHAQERADCVPSRHPLPLLFARVRHVQIQ